MSKNSFIPHSPKLHHCWNLTIRLFSVISRTLVGGGGLTPLQRSSRCILQPQPTGQIKVWKIDSINRKLWEELKQSNDRTTKIGLDT